MKKNFVKYEYYTNSNGKNNHYIFDENYSDEDINHDEFFNSQGPQSTKNNPNCDDKLKQLFEKMIKKENLKKKETKEELKYHSDDSYSYSSDDIDIDNIFKNKKQDDKGKNNVYQKEKIKIKVEEKVEEEEEESDDDLDKFLNNNDYFSDDDSEEKDVTPKNYQVRTIKNSLMNLYSDKGIDNKNIKKENIENKKDDKTENVKKSNLSNNKLEDKKSDIKKSNSSNVNKNIDIEDKIFKEKLSLLKNIQKPKSEIEKLIEINQKEKDKEEEVDKEKEEEEEFEEDEEQFYNDKEFDKPPSKFIRVDTDDDNLEEEFEEEIEEIYEDNIPTKNKKLDLVMNLLGMYSKKKNENKKINNDDKNKNNLLISNENNTNSIIINLNNGISTNVDQPKEIQNEENKNKIKDNNIDIKNNGDINYNVNSNSISIDECSIFDLNYKTFLNLI